MRRTTKNTRLFHPANIRRRPHSRTQYSKSRAVFKTQNTKPSAIKREIQTNVANMGENQRLRKVTTGTNSQHEREHRVESEFIRLFLSYAYKRRFHTNAISANTSSATAFKGKPSPSPATSCSQLSRARIIRIIVVTCNTYAKTEQTGIQAVKIVPDKVENSLDGYGPTVMIIHHAHSRTITDAISVDLGRGSWQAVNRTVAVFETIIKMTCSAFRLGHRRL